MASAVPTSLQGIGEVISPQNNDTFNFADFSSTKIGITLLSSAAPISLQDDTEDSGTPDLGNFDDMACRCYAEERERYCLGLCYPICIGDVLIGTYRIEHKLGHGDFCTVWLAHDVKEERDVALRLWLLGMRETMNTTCRTKSSMPCRTLPISSHI
jgi:hypothetical protein